MTGRVDVRRYDPRTGLVEVVRDLDLLRARRMIEADRNGGTRSWFEPAAPRTRRYR